MSDPPPCKVHKVHSEAMTSPVSCAPELGLLQVILSERDPRKGGENLRYSRINSPGVPRFRVLGVGTSCKM